MKYLILSLFLVGCNFNLDAKHLDNFSTDTVTCGWVYQKDYTLPESNQCWKFHHPDYLGETERGASACDVTSGLIWVPGETVELWSKVGSSGKPDVTLEEVPCN